MKRWKEATKGQGSFLLFSQRVAYLQVIDKKKKGTVNQIKFHTSLTVRELVKKKNSEPLSRSLQVFALPDASVSPLQLCVNLADSWNKKKSEKKKTRKEQKKKRDRKERAYTLDVVKTTGLWLLFKALKEWLLLEVQVTGTESEDVTRNLELFARKRVQNCTSSPFFLRKGGGKEEKRSRRKKKENREKRSQKKTAFYFNINTRIHVP